MPTTKKKGTMKDSLKKLWILTCGVIFTEFSQTSANRQETV